MKKFYPCGKRLLVQMSKDAEKVVGGIVIPEQAQKKPHDAIVHAIGDEVTKVKVGETVIVPRYGGRTIKIDSVEYMIYDEEDVYGVMKEPETLAERRERLGKMRP